MLSEKTKGWVSFIVIIVCCIFVFPILHLGSIVNVILAIALGYFLHKKGWSIEKMFM